MHYLPLTQTNILGRTCNTHTVLRVSPCIQLLTCDVFICHLYPHTYVLLIHDTNICCEYDPISRCLTLDQLHYVSLLNKPAIKSGVQVIVCTIATLQNVTPSHDSHLCMTLHQCTVLLQDAEEAVRTKVKYV